MSSHENNDPAEAQPGAGIENKDQEKVSSCDRIFREGCSIESVVEFGLDKRIGEALRDSGISWLTAAQSAIIGSYLKSVQGCTGFTMIPDYQVASGFSTGKTLAHAIVVVDHLVKYRAWIASRPVRMGLDPKDANTQTALDLAFSTGTAYAMIICPTRFQAYQTWQIYDHLGTAVQIKVAQLSALGSLNLMRGNIDLIKESQATIVVGTSDHILNLAMMDLHSRDIPLSTSTKSVEHRHDIVSQALKWQRLFCTVKVLVVEDCYEFTHPSWEKALAELKTDVLPFFDQSCAYIFVSHKVLDDSAPLSQLQGYKPGLALKRDIFRVVDIPGTGRGDAVFWRVIPRFFVLELTEREIIDPEVAIQTDIMLKLQLRNTDGSRYRNVLIGGTQAQVDDLYDRQSVLDPDFMNYAVRLHSDIDPEILYRTIKEFDDNTGLIMTICATSGFIRDVSLAAHQVIIAAWAPQQKSEIEDVIVAITAAGRMGSKGTAHLYFRCEPTDLQAYINVHNELQKIHPVKFKSAFHSEVYQLHDAIEEAQRIAARVGEEFTLWDIYDKVLALVKLDGTKGDVTVDLEKQAVLEVKDDSAPEKRTRPKKEI